jgi:hypothetical protein
MPVLPIDCRIPLRGTLIASSVLLFLVGGICPSAVANKAKPCTLEWPPGELRARLKTDYSSWKIQSLSDLSVTAKERWQGERRNPRQMEPECPGVAVGEFQTSQLSYAVLLVPIEKPDAAYRLMIFTLSGGTAPGSLETADQWDKGGAANYFIRSVQIAKFFRTQWLKKLKVAVQEGVMSVEAAESEYGAEVYFWANGQYLHEPIDD